MPEPITTLGDFATRSSTRTGQDSGSPIGVIPPYSMPVSSVTTSTARAVLACVQYFVNAERAFLTLQNAREDAIARGREDLVARYTAEMAEVVQSTSYAQVVRDQSAGTKRPPTQG